MPLKDPIKRQQYKQEYYQQNKVEINLKNKKYRKNNKDQLNIYKRKWRKDNSKRNKEYIIIGKIKIKKEVFSHYSNGKIKCYCCGENIIDLLTLDHPNNDGAKHRKKLRQKYSIKGTGVIFYYWLKRNNYPKDIKLQVSCWNCNSGKAIYGICPHVR